jgi:hypothetical protein
VKKRNDDAGQAWHLLTPTRTDALPQGWQEAAPFLGVRGVAAGQLLHALLP